MEQQPRAHRREGAMELIESYLQMNDIPPNGKLPAEREMCEMWGLNRTTLRAAIRRLTEMGKLYSLKGSGTYVSPPKLERNLQDVKSTTEAVRGSGHQLRSRLLESQVILADTYVAQKLQVPVGTKVLYMRRLRIMDGVPLMLESNYVNLDLCPRLVDHDFNNESLYQVLSYYQVYVAQGEESIGITYATEREAGNLQIEEGGALFFLTGIARDYNGVSVEFFKAVMRPDKVRFSSILRTVHPETERRNSNEAGSSGKQLR